MDVLLQMWTWTFVWMRRWNILDVNVLCVLRRMVQEATTCVSTPVLRPVVFNLRDHRCSAPLANHAPPYIAEPLGAYCQSLLYQYVSHVDLMTSICWCDSDTITALVSWL